MWSEYLIHHVSWTGWLVMIVVFLLAYSYLSRSPWRRLPPGPPNLPIIGSLHYLGGDIRESLMKLSAKYGDVFMVYMGPMRVVVLSGYDVIKEALITQSGDFEDRSPMFDGLSDHQGITASSGEHWKQHRRLLLRAMKDFGLTGRRMEAMIQEESELFISALHKVSGEPYNIEPIMKKVASNMISRLFDRHYDYNDQDLTENIKAFDYILYQCSTGNPVWMFNQLKYIPGDIFNYYKTVNVYRRLRKIYKGWIDDCLKRLNNGEEPSDMMGLYLNEMAKAKGDNNNELSVSGLQQLVGQSYMAGTDTTSCTLIWCFLHLILNPSIQVKIQAEIDAVIGPNRPPKMQDRYDMPYTEAVISETQRWANLAPMLSHYTRVERELKGYTIPEHTVILTHLTTVLRDPKLWPNPDVFDPDRFLENGKYKAREEFIPFSLGKHSCPGQGMAKMELFLFLTHLMQIFNFSVPLGQPKPSTEGILGATYEAKPFDMVITKREQIN